MSLSSALTNATLNVAKIQFNDGTSVVSVDPAFNGLATLAGNNVFTGNNEFTQPITFSTGTVQTTAFIGTNQLFSGAYTGTIPSSAGALTQTTVCTISAPSAGIYIMTGIMSISSTNFITEIISTIKY